MSQVAANADTSHDISLSVNAVPHFPHRGNKPSRESEISFLFFTLACETLNLCVESVEHVITRLASAPKYLALLTHTPYVTSR